jgi:hypothetical protein
MLSGGAQMEDSTAQSSGSQSAERLDVAGGGAEGAGDERHGCQKVDFLFVIDNSGSMKDEQDALIAAFPEFMATIRDVVTIDYHVLVTDTDHATDGEWACQAENYDLQDDCVDWCATKCPAGCDCACHGVQCGPWGCERELGGGIVSNDGHWCGIEGGKRHMDAAQPALAETFACLAEVGTYGNGHELPMGAALAALTTQSEPGHCNEGFLRDDAILVVTVITDEEDFGKTPGNPDEWARVMVEAKGGDPDAIVALALVGDNDQPNPSCLPYNDGMGASGAPRIRAWAQEFTHGLWGSVCAPSYAAFFADAVGQIDTACTHFVPEP